MDSLLRELNLEEELLAGVTYDYDSNTSAYVFFGRNNGSIYCSEVFVDHSDSEETFAIVLSNFGWSRMNDSAMGRKLNDLANRIPGRTYRNLYNAIYSATEKTTRIIKIRV